MASVAKAKNLGPTFYRSEEIERVLWDFAVDGGAIGALTLFTAQADLILTHFHAIVKTAITSGGSATVAAGVNGAAGAFFPATAVASFTAGAFFQPTVVFTEGAPNTAVFPLPRKLASGSTIVQTIATAALTAGAVEYVIRYIRA